LLVGSPGLFAQTAQANPMSQAHQALQNIAQLSASVTVRVQQDLLTIET
jgi:predicted secreted protein